ncbi:hypothetical protein ABZY81_29790 [Streptomyces sp. NPDC006514]|uniref:hypothetical protein n=1 Tax=Streptomyces sp. NPDC006514 TaxID=3154308 RepID=UPI0033BBFF81
MAGQLTAADAPSAALRTAGVLERIAARVGREAAGALCEGLVVLGRRPIQGERPTSRARRWR